VYASSSEEVDEAPAAEERSADVDVDDSLEAGLHTTKYHFGPHIFSNDLTLTADAPAEGVNIRTVNPVVSSGKVIQYSAPIKYSSPVFYSSPYLTSSSFPLSTSFLGQSLVHPFSVPSIYSSFVAEPATLKTADSVEESVEGTEEVKAVTYTGLNAFSPLISAFPSSNLISYSVPNKPTVMTYSENPDVRTYTALSSPITYSAPTLVASTGERTTGVTDEGVVQDITPTKYSAGATYSFSSPLVYSFLPTVVKAESASAEVEIAETE